MPLQLKPFARLEVLCVRGLQLLKKLPGNKLSIGSKAGLGYGCWYLVVYVMYNSARQIRQEEAVIPRAFGARCCQQPMLKVETQGETPRGPPEGGGCNKDCRVLETSAKRAVKYKIEFPGGKGGKGVMEHPPPVEIAGSEHSAEACHAAVGAVRAADGILHQRQTSCRLMVR